LTPSISSCRKEQSIIDGELLYLIKNIQAQTKNYLNQYVSSSIKYQDDTKLTNTNLQYLSLCQD
jgi:hypothetical protein